MTVHGSAMVHDLKGGFTFLIEYSVERSEGAANVSMAQQCQGRHFCDSFSCFLLVANSFSDTET